MKSNKEHVCGRILFNIQPLSKLIENYWGAQLKQNRNNSPCSTERGDALTTSWSSLAHERGNVDSKYLMEWIKCSLISLYVAYYLWYAIHDYCAFKLKEVIKRWSDLEDFENIVKSTRKPLSYKMAFGSKEII